MCCLKYGIAKQDVLGYNDGTLVPPLFMEELKGNMYYIPAFISGASTLEAQVQAEKRKPD